MPTGRKGRYPSVCVWGGFRFYRFSTVGDDGEVKRSPNRSANCSAAAPQCVGGFFHCRTMFRQAKSISLLAAVSLGKCPRLLRTYLFRLSIAVVV